MLLPSSSIAQTRNGKNYNLDTKTSKYEPRRTEYTVTKKGKTYTIYMGKTGSCFYKEFKDGKEVKTYLGKEISAQICKEMGVEYKPRKRN